MLIIALLKGKMASHFCVHGAKLPAIDHTERNA